MMYLPEFTPKGVTSPLRKSSRDGAQEPLCSSPKGETNAQAHGHLLWVPPRGMTSTNFLWSSQILLSTHKHA